ncbi:MAG: AI-2E family transporter [Aristaeellaceae bacterium]
MRLEWKSCMRAGVTVVVVYLVLRYWELLTAAVVNMIGAAGPLLLGCAVAYVVNILMCFYERNILPYSKKPIIDRVRRPACMLLAYVTVVLALFFLVRMILPELINALVMIVEQLPGALSKGYAWILEKLAEAGYLDELQAYLPSSTIDWQSTVTKAVNLVISGVGSVLGATVSVVSTTVGQVITLFLGLVFSAYLLLSKEKLSSQFQRLMRGYLGEKTTRKILYFIRTLDKSFHSYIVGQCTEALILGSLCILGMLLFRFPYAVMIGTLVGFTALIPIAGAYIGAVVGAFMIFTVSPLKALLFIVFLVILQQLEGNLIFPRVVGQSIGLPGMWVLAAVTVGGGVAGIPGMLIGVPLTATIYRLLKSDINSRTDMLLPLRSIPAMRDDDRPPADTPPKA